MVTRPATSLVDQVESIVASKRPASIICHAMHPERKAETEPASPARASRVVDDRYTGGQHRISSHFSGARARARQGKATREKVFHHEEMLSLIFFVHSPPPPSAGNARLGTARPPSPSYQHTTTPKYLGIHHCIYTTDEPHPLLATPRSSNDKTSTPLKCTSNMPPPMPLLL